MKLGYFPVKSQNVGHKPFQPLPLHMGRLVVCFQHSIFQLVLVLAENPVQHILLLWRSFVHCIWFHCMKNFVTVLSGTFETFMIDNPVVVVHCGFVLSACLKNWKVDDYFGMIVVVYGQVVAVANRCFLCCFELKNCCFFNTGVWGSS